jgi:hypothetical protein
MGRQEAPRLPAAEPSLGSGFLPSSSQRSEEGVRPLASLPPLSLLGPARGEGRDADKADSSSLPLPLGMWGESGP